MLFRSNTTYHMMQHTNDSKAIALKAPKICFMSWVCVTLRLCRVLTRFNTAYKPQETYLVNVGLMKHIVRMVWRIYSSTEKSGMTAKVAGKISQGTTFIQKQQTLLDSSPKATNSDSKLNKINRERYRGKWFNPCLCRTATLY